MFYGFAVLLLTTLIVALDFDFGTRLFRGFIYIVLTAAADVAGLLMLVGVTIALVRRTVRRPKTLDSSFSDIWPLILLLGIGVSGFLVEGARIRATNDEWAHLSPVGLAAGAMFLGLSTSGVGMFHKTLWWTHTALSMGFVALIPYTKFFHLLSVPTNVFFAKMKARGELIGSQMDREEWLENLDIRVIAPGEECDVIYWSGCCTAFDPTKQKIAVDLCKLLKKCGVKFGVLGRDEICCGDPARVLGDERLFQETALKQVEALNTRKFRVLLTSCPHCYNVLKNEYPQFGGHYDVVHHSEFLHEMLWMHNLKPEVGLNRRIVYHDPCYLGRYQRIYDSPREAIRGITGASVIEMSSAKDRSMCCGGGGGHFWMDLKKGERINNIRVSQALAADANTIVTSCAYCKHMLEDAVKSLDLDEKIDVMDIATLVMSTQISPVQSADY